jgi:hypothetical protein
MTMGTASFLGAGRTVPTVVTASPPGSSPTNGGPPGVVSEIRGQVSEVMQGRLTLIALDTMILGIIAFYLWTRRAQGGG